MIYSLISSPINRNDGDLTDARLPGWLWLYYSSGALARGFDGARRGALGRIDARLLCLVAMSEG